MESIKRHLIRGFWFTLAVVFLFESWLWDHVKEWLRALGQLLGVERFEPWLAARIDRLSPPFILAIFALPAAAVLPLKALAVAILVRGHVLTGLAVVFAAKTLALGVTAFLFDLCRGKLLQIRWFANFYSLVLDVRAWAQRLVAPLRQRIHAVMEIVRERTAAMLGSRNAQFTRKLAALRAFTRRRGDA